MQIRDRLPLPLDASRRDDHARPSRDARLVLTTAHARVDALRRLRHPARLERQFARRSGASPAEARPPDYARRTGRAPD